MTIPAATIPAATIPAASTAGTGDAPAAGLGEAIAVGRARIDELDAQIVALVQQRLEVSRGIQRARLAAGGRRVEHSREVDIVNRYAAALGRPGADVALALLALARGPGIPVERSA